MTQLPNYKDFSEKEKVNEAEGTAGKIIGELTEYLFKAEMTAIKLGKLTNDPHYDWQDEMEGFEDDEIKDKLKRIWSAYMTGNPKDNKEIKKVFK